MRKLRLVLLCIIFACFTVNHANAAINVDSLPFVDDFEGSDPYWTLEDGTPDLRSAVDISNYSDFLLSRERAVEQQTTKFVFDRLSEARGWYWETYRATINSNPTKQDVDTVIGKMVKSGADVLGLAYITD